MSEKITRDELDLYIARLDPKDFNATTLMVTKMVDYINSMELDVKDTEWRLNLALTQLADLNKTHDFEMEAYRQCEEQLKACETALEEAQLHASYEFACVEEYKEEVNSLENKVKKLESIIKGFRKENKPLETLYKPEKECFVTFTGIDCQTELSKLPKGAEYGILFSTKNDTNRYPSIEAIHAMSDYLDKEGYMISLHICGSGAKELLLDKEIKFIDNFQRIQVNGKVKLKKAINICNLYPEHIIIFQYNEDNKAIVNELTSTVENACFLIDASGGKGLSPDNWFNPDQKLFFGYAGGLGEDNILTELMKIDSVASDYFWIDMESKLRDQNDLFSIEKVKNILKLTKGE